MKKTPIKIGQYTIHLRTFVSGKQRAMLLVHGLGVSGDYYLKYAEELAPFYDVYIIDLPGYGTTPKPPKPLTIRQLSGIVTEYVSSAGLKQLVVVGQSMGCQIVAHSIVDTPTLYDKAIMLAPTSYKKERKLLIQAFRLWQDTFHESLGMNMVVFTNYARMGMRRFLITSKFMVQDHIEETLKRATIPVLFVSGGDDNIAPSKWTRYLAKITPEGRSTEMPGAPHLMQAEQPAKLTKITREFIEA